MGEGAMTFLILAGTLMLATVLMVRPALSEGPPLVLQGFNGAGVVLGFTCFIAIAVVMDPLFSFALLLAFLLHEFGHVIAHRLIGHHDARFRLIPFWNGARISDHTPTTDAEAFFIALMGPGVSLGPDGVELYPGPGTLRRPARWRQSSFCNSPWQPVR